MTINLKAVSFQSCLALPLWREKKEGRGGERERGRGEEMEGAEREREIAERERERWRKNEGAERERGKDGERGKEQRERGKDGEREKEQREGERGRSGLEVRGGEALSGFESSPLRHLSPALNVNQELQPTEEKANDWSGQSISGQESQMSNKGLIMTALPACWRRVAADEVCILRNTCTHTHTHTAESELHVLA